MNNVDPFATQRDGSGAVTAELAAAGFDDAVEIGRGGFGIVYQCTRTALERSVAVRCLLQTSTTSTGNGSCESSAQRAG